MLVAGELCENQEVSRCVPNAMFVLRGICCVTKLSIFPAIGACWVVSYCVRKSLFTTKARLRCEPL